MEYWYWFDEYREEFREQYKKDHDNAFLEVIWVANKDINFETDNVYHTKSFNIAYTAGLKGKIDIVNDKWYWLRCIGSGVHNKCVILLNDFMQFVAKFPLYE